MAWPCGRRLQLRLVRRPSRAGGSLLLSQTLSLSLPSRLAHAVPSAKRAVPLPFPSVCWADPPPFWSQLRGRVVQGSWVGVPLVIPGHPTRPPTTTGDGRLFMCPRDTSVPGLEGRLNGSTVKPGGSHWTPAPKQNGVMLEAEAATPWGCSRVGGGSGRAVERRP